MTIQFLNTPQTEIISGGHIYNQEVCSGLKNLGHQLNFEKEINGKAQIVVVDSLYMEEYWQSLSKCQLKTVALIHQIPELSKEAIRFYKAYASFFVTGSNTKSALIEHWKINPLKITVIRPGLPSNWTKRTTYSNKIKHILLIANFIENKGYCKLLQLLPLLDSKNLEFTLVGNPDLQPEFANNLVKQIQNSPFKSKIEFRFNLGRKAIYNELKKTDLFLSLSKDETFGMALYEAISLGVPTLFYKTGEWQLFKEYLNAKMINEYSTTSFINILLDWIDNPKHYQQYCISSLKKFVVGVTFILNLKTV